MIRRMAEPFRGSVELDDGTVWAERDYLSVAGGTIDQIGLNFRPFHRYAEQPGRFHVLGIHTSPMGFVTQLPRIWRAAPMQPGHTYEATTTSVVIRSPNEPHSLHGRRRSARVRRAAACLDRASRPHRRRHLTAHLTRT